MRSSSACFTHFELKAESWVQKLSTNYQRFCPGQKPFPAKSTPAKPSPDVILLQDKHTELYFIPQFPAAANKSEDDLETDMFSGHLILNTVDLAYLARSAVASEHRALIPYSY